MSWPDIVLERVSNMGRGVFEVIPSAIIVNTAFAERRVEHYAGAGTSGDRLPGCQEPRS